MQTATDSIIEAMQILDTQKEGIPFDAIRVLYDAPLSPRIADKVLFALTHAYDDTYHSEEEDYYYPTPLWYAIVAEKYLDEGLIAPVIALFTTTDDEWDFLNEQGQYLIGALAEKFPEAVASQLIPVIDQLIEKKSEFPYLFLFDALCFFDVTKHAPWMLATLEKDFVWYEMFAHHVADLQIKEALPILKRRLSGTHPRTPYSDPEIAQCIQELETGRSQFPEFAKPDIHTRGDWEQHYRKFEDRFFDDEDTPSSNYLSSPKIGRNDPCPCGATKEGGVSIKFKRCHGK